MPRRLRRPAVVVTAAVLLPALAACGGGGSGKASDHESKTGASTSSSAGAAPSGTLSEVSFSGAVGKSLSASWHSAIKAPSSPTVKTLVKGKGSAIASGDTVSAFLYVGDGSTKKDVYSDYEHGAPESIPDNAQLSEVFSKILAGATYGSRVVAVTTATDLLGPSASSNQLGIGAKDSVVVVADLVEKAAVAPTPTDDKAHDVSPGKEPAVVEQKGSPTGFDWSGVAKPALDAPVRRVILKQGTGAAVKATDTVTVNYLGETYQSKTPFDESYSKTPLTSQLSGLIQGWTIGLTGVKVGSRVLLQIPPGFGYGAQGSGASIPGNATLWFVIDVVSVK